MMAAKTKHNRVIIAVPAFPGAADTFYPGNEHVRARTDRGLQRNSVCRIVLSIVSTGRSHRGPATSLIIPGVRSAFALSAFVFKIRIWLTSTSTDMELALMQAQALALTKFHRRCMLAIARNC